MTHMAGLAGQALRGERNSMPIALRDIEALPRRLRASGMRPPHWPRRMDSHADSARLRRPHRVGHAVSGRHHSDPNAGRMGAQFCEDGVVFADAALRAGLRARHPAVIERIEARQRFVRDELGIPIKDSILPLSSTPLCLPPFWLAAGPLLALA
jgi:hypothetical protein